MEAIILAGGFGKRLRAVVADVPKPMAAVAGAPFLEILLSELIRKGFQKAILSVGYKAEVIISHFGACYKNLKLDYAVEESPLGTGGAIRKSLAKTTSDHIYIFNGDTFIELNIDAIEKRWNENRRPIIITRSVPDVSRYGSLHVEDDRLVRFIEKGVHGPGLINAGCYVLPDKVLNGYLLGAPFSMESDFLAKVVDSQHIDALEVQGLFIDIGIPEDYRLAQELLAHHR